MATRVLVVAGKAPFRAAMTQALREAGHLVDSALNVEDARALIAAGRVEATIIAPTYLGNAGVKLARGLRKEGHNPIVVADRRSEIKRLAKLIPAADICMFSPANAQNLLDRISREIAVSGRAVKEVVTSLVCFEGCTIDLAARTCTDAEGFERALTRGELALLFVFLRNPGRVLSREQLRRAVGGRSADGLDRGVDMLVARLRKKIETDPALPRLIMTVAGVGYRLALRSRSIKWLSDEAHDARRREGAYLTHRAAERRQVTVAAGQIVGFSALSGRLDPEDLQDITDAIHRTCTDVLAQFDGQLVKFLGDSLLMYFGYPQAHEDDAERAILAGLELVCGMTALRARFNNGLRLRVGIATGLLVIGSGGGAHDMEGHSAVGEPLNLAVRIQTAAPPNGVLVAAATRKLAGLFFEYETPNSVPLDRGVTPVRAWRVTGHGAAGGRFDALHRAGMAAFVGRTEELKLLRRDWSQACASAGRVVLMTGELGIGKSRLALAFEKQAKPAMVLRFFAAARRTDTSLFVITSELERSAGFELANTAATKLKKLSALLKQCGPRTQAELPCLAHLLSLPTDTAGISRLSPQKRKERIFTALLTRIEELASRQPVLIQIEDAHWADPTSLEFFMRLVERASRLRIMILVTARSEFIAPWSPHANIRTMELSRLGPDEAESLVRNVMGSRPLPRDVKSQILARADGIPLFLEEITKTVIEQRSPRQRRGRLGSIDLNRLDVPPTLQASILARLDRLGRAKEIAQIGAVIGREFSYDLLSAVTSVPEPELGAMLDRLTASGLLFRRGFLPYATYLFKHALVRDAAYDMLLHRRRNKLHAAIAASLEQKFPETRHSQPELLAHHYREAGNVAMAINYLVAAAENALLRSGLTEALSRLAQAQDLISTIPESEERAELELRLEVILGRTFTARRSYTAPETRDVYRQARARCEALGNEALLPMTLLGQWVGTWSAAEHQSALKEAEDLYSYGERKGDPAVLAVGHMALGMSMMLLGNIQLARRHFEQALHINHFALPLREPHFFSDLDGRISSMTYLHDCLLLLGFPDQADSVAKRAEAVAKEAEALTPSQSYSRALAQNHILRMHGFRRDTQKLLTVGSALLRLSKEQDYPYFIGTSMIYTGWASVQSGETGRALELCHKGMAQLRSIGSNCWFPRYFALLAECYEHAAQIKRGIQAIADALQAVEVSGERVWEAEIHRLKGRLLLRARRVDEAEAHLVQAMGIAQGQQARLLELRAATDLAGLLKQTRRGAQGQRILASIYKTFTEGFDQFDLRAARMILEGN